MSETSRALVTGASRGLGASIAFDLARHGYEVVICARSLERLERQAAVARGEGLVMWPVVADITDERDVDVLMTRVEELGGLDLCVNNAGTNNSHQLVRQSPSTGEIRRYPLPDWERTIDLCLMGTFLIGRGAAALMLPQHRGVIVNISSSVRRGAFGQSAYAAAKAGVESLTRTWAYELGDHGVRVVAVTPGILDGERLRERVAANPRHGEYLEMLKQQQPLQRWTSAEDVCAAVRFAADNTSLTGTILEVDCGGVPPRVRV